MPTASRTVAPRNPQTARYLKLFSTPVLPLPETAFAEKMYGGRYVTRPVFLDASEWPAVYSDIDLVRTGLVQLGDRCYGGDLAAFGRAAGMNERQCTAIARLAATGPGQVSRMARADLYRDAGGFSLMELNIGSTVGGLDDADLCRAALSDAGFADFAAREHLTYIDTMAEAVATIRAETGTAGGRPMIGAIEWPENYEYMQPYMDLLAARWTELGLDAISGRLDELHRAHGRLWLRDRPIDILYRQFMIEDIADDEASAARLEPMLAAAEAGEVRVFTPLDSELYGSKGALALLSEAQADERLDADVRAAVARLVPWTRIVRSGPTVLPDGTRGDLLEYAATHRAELVVKPSYGYGGNGLIAGWVPDLTDVQWRDRLDAALSEPHVLQYRVRPVPELFPTEDGRLEPWTVTWGVFTMHRGYAGTLLRCAPHQDSNAAINHNTGAHMGCCFHVTPHRDLWRHQSGVS